MNDKPITESELSEKIRQWVREYGPDGPYWSGGGNILAVLIDHKGFIPNSSGCFGAGSSVADEVEQAVKEMAMTPGEPGRPNECFKWAMVLRAYYLTSNDMPDEERIRRLRVVGLSMDRYRYLECVRLGRAFLEGYFNGMRAEIRHQIARAA